MNATETQSPFYQRVSLVLLSLAIIAVALVLGKDIILPLMFGVLVSTLLLPLTNFLSRKGFPKVISIVLPVLLALVSLAGVLYFLSHQVMNFIHDTPALKERLLSVSTSFQSWVDESLNITVTKQNEYIKETVEDIKDKGPQLVGKTFGSITGILAYLILLPIYTFLMLYYKDTIKAFIIGVFKNGSETKVREILTESSSIAQHYVIGLMIETTIVFTLNTIGFLILGIKYAIFLALLAALLNLIPYVGMLIANLFCMLVTLVTSDNVSDVLWVGVVLAIVQFIDNNFGMPMIVGNKVRINALVTIVGVLIGGTLCGIPGMFLAIPALAVTKVICDKVPDLNPWGVLLGDSGSGDTKLKKQALKTASKVKEKKKEVEIEN